MELDMKCCQRHTGKTSLETNAWESQETIAVTQTVKMRRELGTDILLKFNFI